MRKKKPLAMMIGGGGAFGIENIIQVCFPTIAERDLMDAFLKTNHPELYRKMIEVCDETHEKRKLNFQVIRPEGENMALHMVAETERDFEIRKNSHKRTFELIVDEMGEEFAVWYALGFNFIYPNYEADRYGSSPVVNVVSYTGKYPNLCNGDLVVVVNGKFWHFGENALRTGGRCTYNRRTSNCHTYKGPWTIKFPEGFPEDLQGVVTDAVNDRVEHGCCGGCT